MNAMINDAGIVTIGMSKEQAKELMAFTSKVSTIDLRHISDKYGLDIDTSNVFGDVLYTLYSALDDLREDGGLI